jgi:hypothetical protein
MYAPPDGDVRGSGATRAAVASQVEALARTDLSSAFYSLWTSQNRTAA